VVRQGEFIAEQRVSIPLACPVQWFFEPPPEECPNEEPDEVPLVEQSFERGRVVFNNSTDIIYVLFNDGQSPAWVAFANDFNPETDPELEESFVPPEGFFQPITEIGFVWRRETVRNRIGLGIEPQLSYDGFLQTALQADGSETLYISSTGSTVLQLNPNGNSWEIITLG